MNLKALHPKRRKNWTLTNEMPSSGKINDSFIKTNDVELAECFPAPRGLTPGAPTTKAIESFSRMKKSLIQVKYNEYLYIGSASYFRIQIILNRLSYKYSSL